MELADLGWQQRKVVQAMTQREQAAALWDGWYPRNPYKNRVLIARIVWDIHDTGPWIDPSMADRAKTYDMSRTAFSMLVADISDQPRQQNLPRTLPALVEREVHEHGRRTKRIAVKPRIELPPDPRPVKVAPASTERAPQAPVTAVEVAPVVTVAVNGAGPVEEPLTMTTSDKAILVMRLAGEIFRDVDSIGPAHPSDEIEGLAAEVESLRERMFGLEREVAEERRKRRDAEETALAHLRALDALRKTNGRLDENLRAILKGQPAPDNRDARMFRQLMEGK